jgi:hypothetical protein
MPNATSPKKWPSCGLRRSAELLVKYLRKLALRAPFASMRRSGASAQAHQLQGTVFMASGAPAMIRQITGAKVRRWSLDGLGLLRTVRSIPLRFPNAPLRSAGDAGYEGG